MIVRQSEEFNGRSAVLNNPDILEEIFENLEVDHVWEMDVDEVVLRRKVLGAAALTCKAFMEPALDRLWRSLDKLFPLFKLLPAFYRSDTTFVLRGNISEEDWTRFDWYARRVKTFSYTRDPDSLDIAMHVYFRIAQLRRLPLLPCLRHLRCPHISQDDFLISSICLFLTPSLKTIEFEKITAVEDKLVGTFLHTLLCEGARVEVISLAGDGLTTDTLSYLGRCRDLRSLVVMGMGVNLDIGIVKEMGMIPGLMRLELDLEGSSIAGGGGGGEGSEGGSGVWMLGEIDLGFRELVALELVAPLWFAKGFLTRIGTTQLAQIGFESSGEGSVLDRKELLECIVRRWRETLVEVRMVHAESSEEGTGIPGISMDTIAPLLSLSRLTHFELEGYTMELNDENIGEIVSAWKGLRELHLPFMGAGTRRPTVGSLRTVAEGCVDLKCLTLPLDTREMGSVLIGEGISLHSLETLGIGSADEPWELRDGLVLARYIDHLFPFLVKVVGQQARWQQVHEIIKMYQSVRAEAVAICRLASVM